MEPVIFHVDVNSAFLSWSAVKRLRDDPSGVDLRDIVSAVGGDVETRHGVITARSIPAKKYHIQTGEPVVKALQKYPELVLVPSDFRTYRTFSRRLMAILRQYASAVEQVSIDEAYLDMTQPSPPVHFHSPRNGYVMPQAMDTHIPGDLLSPYGSPGKEQELMLSAGVGQPAGRQAISVLSLQALQKGHTLPFPFNAAIAIQEEVYKELGFTVNVGISNNRLLAKMASDFTKPGRIHTLWPEEIRNKMWPLPIGELHGCGGKSAARLHDFGILTIGDAAVADVSLLQSVLGEKGGMYIHNAANGLSSHTVTAVSDDAKSYSNETTVPNDIIYENYDTDALPVIHQLSENVARRLQKDGFFAGTIEFSVKTDDFRRHSRQMKLSSPVNDAASIEAAALQLSRNLLFGKEQAAGTFPENIRYKQEPANNRLSGHTPLGSTTPAGNSSASGRNAAYPGDKGSGLFALGRKVRLIGVGATSLDRGEYRQLDLFAYMKETALPLRDSGHNEEPAGSLRHHTGQSADLAGRTWDNPEQNKALSEAYRPIPAKNGQKNLPFDKKDIVPEQQCHDEAAQAQAHNNEKEQVQASWQNEPARTVPQRDNRERDQALAQMVAQIRNKYGNGAVKKGMN